MLRFTLESYFDSLPELKKEVEDLLWRIEHAWPMTIAPDNISDGKKRIESATVKLNGGALRCSIDSVDSIHDHKGTCSCCPLPKGDQTHGKSTR